MTPSPSPEDNSTTCSWIVGASSTSRLRDSSRRSPVSSTARTPSRLSRAVERVLRMGANDLDLRESELSERFAKRRLGRSGFGPERRSGAAHERARRRRAQARSGRAARAGACRARDADRRTRGRARGPPSARSDVELAFVPGISYRLIEIEPHRLSRARLSARRGSVRRSPHRPVTTPERQTPLRLSGARSTRSVVGRKLVGKLIDRGPASGRTFRSHGLEPTLGLRREELRDRHVVLGELPKSHLVELHQAPWPAPDTQGEHQQRVHRELAQDERLGRIHVVAQERHRARLVVRVSPRSAGSRRCGTRPRCRARPREAHAPSHRRGSRRRHARRSRRSPPRRRRATCRDGCRCRRPSSRPRSPLKPQPRR